MTSHPGPDGPSAGNARPPAPAPGRAAAADAAAHSRAPAGADASLGRRFARLLRREPLLAVSLVYACVSLMGVWSNYAFYRTLGVPILDYLQGSDLFVMGLKRPDYAFVLGMALFVAAGIALPVRWTERNPERARALRDRGWWWRLLVPPQRRTFMSLWGMRSETVLPIAAFVFALLYLWLWNTAAAERVLAGKTERPPVRLTLAGADAPLPGRAQLLGTTSAYVLVWWDEQRRVEALPIANLARIQSMTPASGEPVAPTHSGAAPAP